MHRVDAIGVPADSPLGAITVGGGRDGIHLAEYDLIMVLGPNGSGKTRLTEPLMVKSSRDVNCLTLVGDSAPLNVDTDIARPLVSRNSTELLGDFMSVSKALAMASGNRRTIQERTVLQKVADQLDGLVTKSDAVRSYELSSALDHQRFRESEAIRVLGDLPISLGVYNAIGREVAQLGGKAWTEQRTIDEARMNAEESRVAPEALRIKGHFEFNQACQAIPKALDLDRLLSLRNTAVSKVGEAARKARELVGDSASAIPVEDLVGHCRNEAGRLEDDKARRNAEAERHNALLDLLRKAHALLEKDPECSSCLVCGGAIERQRLIAELAARFGDDHEGGRLRRESANLGQRAGAIRDTAQRLEDAIANQSRTAVDVRESLKSFMDDFELSRRAFESIPGAADEVTKACTQSAEEMARVQPLIVRAIDSGNEESIGSLKEGLAGLDRSITRECGDLDRKVAELNANLRRADAEHRKLRPLREALVAAQEANRLEWRQDWRQKQEEERQQEALKPWKEAIQAMVAERKQREDTVNQRIMQDDRVRERFRNLIARLPHPTMRDLILEEDRITDGRTTVFGRETVGKQSRNQSILSEGYQVLLNLAAFIAVAGHCPPGQDHKAGWILVDEPTNGLDPANRRHVAEFLGSLDVEAMPRQMFITTFEREFMETLVAKARQAGSRRCLVIELEDWKRSPIAPPRIYRPY